MHDNVTITFIGYELQIDGLQLNDDTIMRGLIWLGLFEHVSSGGSLCYECNIINVVLFWKKATKNKVWKNGAKLSSLMRPNSMYLALMDYYIVKDLIIL